MMRTLAACVALGLLCSCSALESIERTVASIDKTVSETRAEADVNKDGTVSGQEWRDYLLGLLGLGGLTGAGALARRNGQSNERKAKNEAEVAALAARVARVESAS